MANILEEAIAKAIRDTGIPEDVLDCLNERIYLLGQIIAVITRRTVPTGEWDGIVRDIESLTRR